MPTFSSMPTTLTGKLRMTTTTILEILEILRQARAAQRSKYRLLPNVQ
jgi:hypothetical protein